MPNSVYDQIAREHPAYRQGFTAGQDVGLRLALDTLTAERVHQDRLAAAEPDSGSPAAARLAYTAAVLVDVTRVVAARSG